MADACEASAVVETLAVEMSAAYDASSVGRNLMSDA
jgi:hypothetical protein